MKMILAAGLLILSAAQADSGAIPHLDLEMTTEQYRQLLKENQHKSIKADPQISMAINLGERLSKWILKINTGRTPDNAIRLTSSATRVGIPIDKPNVYSPSLIGQKTMANLRDLPPEMKNVLTGTGELPANSTLDDDTFIKHARLIDKNYQMAARYKSVDVYRSSYVMSGLKDVRGYYYLTKNKIGAQELRDVSLIPAGQKVLIKEALIRVCANTYGGFNSCITRVDKAFRDNTLANFYNTAFPYAKANWESFFIIPAQGVRRDVQWSATRMVVPFNTPSIAKFTPYLKNNIEDEFRFGAWSLKLNFGSFSNGPRLLFKPGVVPHVNALGGNDITMDSNQSIEEYESQWTIRHEFGHVVGLPDCYHEFYDNKLKAYVNYQLDTSDLMCSRAGNINERIFEQLKKVYSK